MVKLARNVGPPQHARGYGKLDGRARHRGGSGRARCGALARAAREAEGVPIDDKSLADILAAGRSLGLSQAELDRALGA